MTAAEVAPSIERHLGNPRPVALSRAALEVLAIVAYRQPIARAGIELIRGSASDSALDTLLERGLIEEHQPLSEEELGRMILRVFDRQAKLGTTMRSSLLSRLLIS